MDFSEAEQSFAVHAEHVNRLLASTIWLQEWPELYRYVLASIQECPKWLLSLPVIACQAVGGASDDGVRVAAGWAMVHHAGCLLDAVEDGDFVPDGGMAKNGKALNYSTALIYASYRLVSIIQFPGGSNRVTNVFSKCGFGATQGQDMSFALDLLQNEEALQAYWQSVILKSGNVIRMAAAGGAAAGTEDSRYIEALGDYGTALGVILQILDDCQDMLQGKVNDSQAMQNVQKEISLPILLYSIKAKTGQVDIPGIQTKPDLFNVLSEAGIPQIVSEVLLDWQQRANESLESLKQTDAWHALRVLPQIILNDRIKSF